MVSDFDRVGAIISNISYPDRTLVLTYRGDHFTVHVVYLEPDVDNPDQGPVLQESRRWLIEPDATPTDVVATCFAAIMRSFEHVVREHFCYDGIPVYSPHHTLSQLASITLRRKDKLLKIRQG